MRCPRFTSSVILKIVYGYDTLDEDDPMVKHVNNILSVLGDASAPGQILEVLPWRTLLHAEVCQPLLMGTFPVRCLPSWFPGTGFKLQAQNSRVFMDTAVEEPFKYAVQKMVRIQISHHCSQTLESLNIVHWGNKNEGTGESNFVTNRLPKVISPEELQWLKDSAFTYLFGKLSSLLSSSAG